MHIDPSASPASTPSQKCANLVALLSFFVAAAALFVLERLVWCYSILPHTSLLSYVSIDGVVLAQRVDELRTGAHVWALPRAVYRYEVNGKSFENAVIRHPNDVSSNASGEGGDFGEIRFEGANGRQQAEKFLEQYPIGRKVTVWVNPAKPAEATLIRNQNLRADPFLNGLVPGIFVPFCWLFLVVGLHNTFDSPAARWAALGWGVLTLASLAPVFWEYQRLLGADGPDHFSRLQNVGLGLAVITVIASLFPRPYCSAIACGLILGFTLFGLVGLFSAFATVRITGSRARADGALTWSMECALVSGTVLGLLLGLSARLGWVTIQPSKFDSCRIRGQ